MCRNLSSNSQKSVDERPNGSKLNEGNSCLANVSSAKIFLPILKIRMRGPRKSVSVRARYRLTQSLHFEEVSKGSRIRSRR